MEYFIKVYGKASIANALLNFYEWFIDPVTKEILEDINLTTDMVSLTIYAVSLLADSQHSSILNQRISRVRNFEIIPMVLYGVLAKHYVTFRNSNGRKKYAIPRDAVIKDLLSVVTVEETSTLNPTLEMETTHGVSFKGFHGNNLDDMYTIATRSYDKSMTGIIAPSSPPDAGCGLNKMLSLEPNITNIRGYAAVGETDSELNKLEDVNLFSPGELSMPGAATIDDPSRLGHAIKQSKHVITVNDSDPVIVSNVLTILNENSDASAAIQKAINYMGDTLNIDRIAIWEYQDDRNFVNKTFEWQSASYPYADGNTENLSSIQWEEVDTLSITGTYHTANTSSIRLNNFGKGAFHGVNEFIQSKFTYGGSTIGYIGFFNYSEDDVWTNEMIETCNLFTKALHAYIQLKYLETRL